MVIEDDIKESTLNAINSLCNELNFFISPNIEEKMGCDFDCCVGNSILPNIERMIEVGQKEGLFENEGLELLREVVKELEELIDIDYDEQKGFSKTQRWLDFVDLVNKVNVFLKDVLQQHNVADV